ncbi:MAG: hypothetical protein KDE26_05880, partial [Bacteroidetes bacterium]|nr:hypothetical protein [Bacteroidota bacterium]
VEENSGDGWLIQDDKTPNAGACKLLGFKAISVDDLKAKLEGKKISLLYSLENDQAFAALGNAVSNSTVIAHGHQHQDVYELVDVLLPAACSIEAEGTFINFKGIPQVSKMAKQIKQMTPEMWMRLPKSRLDKGAVAVDRWRNLDNIFDVLPGWQLISAIAKVIGAKVNYDSHQKIFAAMQADHAELKDVKVSYKPSKASFKSTQLDFAPKW